jgi:transposase-like protein
LWVDRNQVAIHDRVHKAGLQPISTVAADQLAVGEKAIRLHGQDPWLYGAVGPERNPAHEPVSDGNETDDAVVSGRLPSTLQLDGVEFLVDDASYLDPVPAEDGYRFRMLAHGNRNTIERVFRERERRTSLLANIFGMSS